MVDFGGGADDGGLPPSSSFGPRSPAPDEAPLYPAYLDDPAADPGRADFECRDWEAEEGDAGGGDPVILHPAAVAARNHQRSVEALLAGLSAVDAAEAELHAMRVLMVRGIAELLGAGAASELVRCQAPSLTAAEIAAELSLAPRAARSLVAESLALTSPEAAPVLRAMQEGRLDRSRAQTILHSAAPLPAEAVAAYLDRAAALAGPADDLAGQGADGPRRPTVPALSRALRRMAEEHSAQTLTRRARLAREHRRVDIEPGEDGMCHLSAYVPLEAGAAIDTRLQAIARSQASREDSRTTAQRRADAFTDLLLAPGPSAGPWDGDRGLGPRGGVRTEVVVTIPATTLLPLPLASTRAAAGTTGTSSEGPAAELAAAGLAFGDDPGEVLGYGPIDAATARRLAAQADTWLRVLTDPQSGAPLALGRTRYTPPPALRRFLAARDASCRFPACDRAHPHTEADHTHEWSRGGTTDPSNLALLCSEHHRIKTLGYWTAAQTGSDGTIVWTSPLGRTHTTSPGLPRPPDHLREESPPPF